MIRIEMRVLVTKPDKPPMALLAVGADIPAKETLSEIIQQCSQALLLGTEQKFENAPGEVLDMVLKDNHSSDLETLKQLIQLIEAGMAQAKIINYNHNPKFQTVCLNITTL